MRDLAILVMCIFTFACEPGWGFCPPKQLKISMARSTVEPTLIRGAAEFWNEALGQEVVILDEGGGVEVLGVDYIDTHCGGNVSGCAIATVGIDGVSRECVIYIGHISFWGQFPASQIRLLAHELGHCMGLDHDDYKKSIMYIGATEYQEIMIEHIEHVLTCIEK